MRTVIRTVHAIVFLLAAGICAAQSPTTYPWVYSVPNDSGTGTTQFKLAKLSAGKAIVAATTDTAGFIGVCVSQCGTAGDALIAYAGRVPMIVDGTTTLDHYVTNSSTVTGDGHDTGATTYPGSGAVLGRVLTASSGAGSTSIILLGLEIQSATGGSSGVSAFNTRTGAVTSAVGDTVETINAQTGAGYTIISGDNGKLVTLSNASAQTVNLPSSVPAAGWFVDLENIGVGVWTISGNGNNIDGASNTVLLAPVEGTRVVSDGTSYYTQQGRGNARTANAQTGTTYTVSHLDRGKVVTLSNASAVAVTLPQAGSSSTFRNGWYTFLKNIGAGTVTVTPTTSTISGAATITLETGEFAMITSDGTNYEAETNRLTQGSNVTLTKSRTGTAIAASSGGLTKLWYSAASSATISGTSQTRFFPVFSNGNATSVSPGVSPAPVTGTVGDVHICFAAAIPGTDSIVVTLQTGTDWSSPGAGTMTDSGTVVATITTSSTPSTGGSAGTAGCYAIGTTQAVTVGLPVVLKVTSSTGTTGNVSWYASLTP